METISFNDLRGTLAVITGGAGLIGRTIGAGLAGLGVRTVILDLDADSASAAAEEILRQTGIFSMGLHADVLDRSSLLAARETIHREAGRVQFLINGAGGNAPGGTTRVEEVLHDQVNDLSASFFGLDMKGMEQIFDLNYFGTILPTMVFATDMVEDGKGAVLNISSLSAFHPLTKVPAYSSAKAAINNFTEWLAVHLAKTGVRVNALAPGFLLTRQNRFLLVDDRSGDLLPRGEKIIAATPMGRFGETVELTGPVAFLLSDMARFITGTVLLVDGGYNAYSGV